MKLLVLLLIAIAILSVQSKPITRATTPEDCDFEGLFGNTKLIRQRCIEQAMLDTKGMYLNLVQTFQTRDGPKTFPIDRPNNHGPIYQEISTPSNSE